MTDLGKMYGPLPLGAWVAVIGGGLGLALYTRKQSTAPDTGDPSTDVATDEFGNPVTGATDSGAGGSGLWTQLTPPATNNTEVGGAITDNDEWGRQALNYLIASNYNPTVADSAIRKYLNSTRLSVSENALINAALRHLGAPPIPLAPGPAPKPTPSPTPKPVPHPRNYRVYVVKHGDTLSSISKRFGLSPVTVFNANRVGFIRADGSFGWMYNRSSSVQHHVGARVIIPGNGK